MKMKITVDTMNIAVILGVLFFCNSALGLNSEGGVFSGLNLWGRLQQDNKSLPLPDFERPAIQQDNNYKEFMTWITDGGLRYAVAKQNNNTDADKFYRKMTAPRKRRHVIVVGAGMAGLSAAYELAQSGHEVTILESQSRVGGRVKTIRQGLADGLNAEGGAMRLPYNHYLTRHYIELFNVETRTFKNYNENTFLYMYGERITTKEWEENNKRYTNKWWPGWDANYPRKLKKTLKIEGILSLYDLTVQPVMEELGAQPTEAQWQAWIEKWSTLSLEDFLRTTTYQKDDQPQLRPWTEEAIQAFATSTYITPLLQESLVFWLREDLGQWWKEPMYAPTNGMDSLPKAFMNKNEAGWNKDVDLSKNIVYGVKVDKVEELVSGRVQVKGTNIYTGLSVSVEGDAVFLALPLPILRQLDIPLSVEKQKAMASITYESSTKILLQCKTRFWQNTVGKGGASKTNMQIGQLVYPGHDGDGITRNKRGILVVYTWNQEALTFGAMSDKDAIASAVRQISKIHPEMVSQFEVGKVQAWHSDPSALGAFAGLKPYEYMNAFKALIKPTETIYMAGEAMSWSSTWIQGAVFSGLMQAYSFQEYLETDTITSPKDIIL